MKTIPSHFIMITVKLKTISCQCRSVSVQHKVASKKREDDYSTIEDYSKSLEKDSSQNQDDYRSLGEDSILIEENSKSIWEDSSLTKDDPKSIENSPSPTKDDYNSIEESLNLMCELSLQKDLDQICCESIGCS